MRRFFRQIRQRLLPKANGTENRFRNYLLYAVGEILLVVIGILIALQIDTWNEDRKNAQKVEKYRQALLTDLKKDQLLVENILRESKEDIEEINAFRERLTSEWANLDTVYQIARYEFSPLLNRYTEFNDNTYTTLVSTGDLGLLDQSVAESLNRLYKSQDAALIWTNETFVLYRDLGGKFLQKFPLKVRFSPIGSGPVNELLWNTADRGELAIQLNAVLTSRQAHNHVTINWFSPVLEEIENAVNSLGSNQ